MAWRAASSLLTLRDQLNAAYPGWLFLGFLGDQAHASVPSDHNPNSAGVVTALDIGPGGGLDIHALADRLAARPHPDLKYIISNRRIFEWQNGFRPTPYYGSDPHDTHIHISVGRGSDGQSVPPYDDTTPWNINDNQGEIMIPSASHLTALFQAFWGRDPSASEIKTYVGQPYNGLVELLAGSPTFGEIAQNRFIGSVARRDNWQGQIEGLLAKVKSLEAGQKITPAEKDALKAKVNELATSLETAYNN